jgi:nucleoside 2-deoxyribosyltransferase
MSQLRIYLAGPLFSEGERAFLDALADRLRDEGHDVFVPHEQFDVGEVMLDPSVVWRIGRVAEPTAGVGSSTRPRRNPTGA